MNPGKLIVTTQGMTEEEGRPLFFLEAGRGARADEAFFIMCEATSAGRRVFEECVAQFKRGKSIRTPEQYVELVREMASSCGELVGGRSISFVTAFVSGGCCWGASDGEFSMAFVPAEGSLSRAEECGGVWRMEPGARLFAGGREALSVLREGETVPGEGAGGHATVQAGLGPVIVVESVGEPVPNGAAGRQRVSRARSRGFGSLRSSADEGSKAIITLNAQAGRTGERIRGRLKALGLSTFGWLSFAGAIAIVVVLLLTVWPSHRKTSRGVVERAVSTRRQSAVAPVDTTRTVSASRRSSTGELGLSLKWKRAFGGAVTSSPTVSEGKVYFGSRDGGLYCLDAGSGEQTWKFASGTGIGASPTVSGDRVFVGGYDGSFWCVDAHSGQKVWEFNTRGKIVSSACVASGSVLFGSHDRSLYCVAAKDGKLRWKYGVGGIVWSSPRADKGRVFFGSADGTFYCLSLDSGQLVWKYNAGRGIYSSPAVGEGTVCFGSNAGRFCFLDASTGKELFVVDAGRDVRASPLLCDGAIYGASDDGTVRCISLEKRTSIWTFKTARSVRSTPFVSGGVVYVTSYDGKLYALDASTGKKMASYDVGAEIYSSPAVSGNAAYFGANNGGFYCLEIGPSKNEPSK